jgi:hypothetical protein
MIRRFGIAYLITIGSRVELPDEDIQPMTRYWMRARLMQMMCNRHSLAGVALFLLSLILLLPAQAQQLRPGREQIPNAEVLTTTINSPAGYPLVSSRGPKARTGNCQSFSRSRG